MTEAAFRASLSEPCFCGAKAGEPCVPVFEHSRDPYIMVSAKPGTVAIPANTEVKSVSGSYFGGRVEALARDPDMVVSSDDGLLSAKVWLTPEALARDPLAVRCPTCGTAPGVYCFLLDPRAPVGSPAQQFHPARLAAPHGIESPIGIENAVKSPAFITNKSDLPCADCGALPGQPHIAGESECRPFNRREDVPRRRERATPVPGLAGK